MKILLDTNFIIEIIKNKIDLHWQANNLISKNIEWLVPQDVLNELGNLKDKPGTKIEDKKAATLSFEIIQTLNPIIISLPSNNPNVDIKIINYIMDKPIVLATQDKNLKSRVNNKILSIRNKNSLKLI